MKLVILTIPNEQYIQYNISMIHYLSLYRVDLQKIERKVKKNNFYISISNDHNLLIVYNNNNNIFTKFKEFPEYFVLKNFRNIKKDPILEIIHDYLVKSISVHNKPLYKKYINYFFNKVKHLPEFTNFDKI